MSNFDDLFSSPIAALGLGLLSSNQNPIGSAVDIWQKSAANKRAIDQQALQNQVLQAQIKEYANKSNNEQIQNKIFQSLLGGQPDQTSTTPQADGVTPPQGNGMAPGSMAPSMAPGAPATGAPPTRSGLNLDPRMMSAMAIFKPDIANALLGVQKFNNENDPQAIASKKRAEKAGELRGAKDENYSKALSSLNGFQQQADLVTGTIDKALGTINYKSTGYGAYFSGVPNSEAGKLENYLNTIKANIGFDKLQEMRNNSPTGGALGQVSDTENKLLQAVNGALDPKQSDQLKENLINIKALYPAVLAERKKAFQIDYGNMPGIGNAASPAPATNNAQPVGVDELPDPSQYAGKSIIDTMTKKTLISNGKQWVPQ